MPTQVALQPTANRDSRKHYADTIARPVPIERIRQLGERELADRLYEQTGQPAIPIWGVTPGGRGVNRGKWERLQEGAVVLFARDGGIISSARVAAKAHNEPLAVELWGRNAEGETWEYIYFLEDLKEKDIPYRDLNAERAYYLSLGDRHGSTPARASVIVSSKSPAPNRNHTSP